MSAKPQGMAAADAFGPADGNIRAAGFVERREAASRLQHI
jgi:hypothetical protein